MPATSNTYSRETYFATRLQEDSRRSALWKVLCGYLQSDVPPAGAVLELGGGYCHFINNIRAADKHVVDLYDGLPECAAPDVKAHVQSCTSLNNFANRTFDAVFASNLFEHLTRAELEQTLSEIRRVLRPEGRLIIIQPNYKFSCRDYFDDYTHIQVFTHVSLVDLLGANGFAAVRVVPRFLPFSLKARGPKWPWLLHVYLALPWRPAAGQMYIVATPKTNGSPGV